MSDSKSSASGGGIGFCGVLAIVFIVLKLVGTITWSWWWVLSPIWIPTALVLAVFLFCVLAMCISGVVVMILERK